MSLHPFVEDGLIRIGGRLLQVEATFEEFHPVLVKKCGVIDQLVHTGTVISKAFGSCDQRRLSHQLLERAENAAGFWLVLRLNRLRHSLDAVYPVDALLKLLAWTYEDLSTLRRTAKPGSLCSHACQLVPSIWRL